MTVPSLSQMRTLRHAGQGASPRSSRKWGGRDSGPGPPHPTPTLSPPRVPAPCSPGTWENPGSPDGARALTPQIPVWLAWALGRASLLEPGLPVLRDGLGLAQRQGLGSAGRPGKAAVLPELACRGAFWASSVQGPGGPLAPGSLHVAGDQTVRKSVCRNPGECCTKH